MMAKANIEKVEVIRLTLELDREEANYLMALVQNPINADASEKERALLSAIFHAIKGPTRG